MTDCSMGKAHEEKEAGDGHCEQDGRKGGQKMLNR
jgi:hypothetical protein